jgi:hypothetical protein
VIRKHSLFLARVGKNAILFFAENPFHLQAVYIGSANWCEDWTPWLGEGHSVVPFVVIRVMSLVGRGGIILISET